jgi:hypothetical protein
MWYRVAGVEEERAQSHKQAGSTAMRFEPCAANEESAAKLYTPLNKVLSLSLTPSSSIFATTEAMRHGVQLAENGSTWQWPHKEACGRPAWTSNRPSLPPGTVASEELM